MRTRTVTVVLTALTLAGGLTACTQAAAYDLCENPLQNGALSSNVTTLGGFGEEPVVSFPSDVLARNAQLSVLVAAEDRADAVVEDSIVSVNYAAYDSVSGALVERSEDFTDGRGGDLIPVRPGTEQSTLVASLECAAPGDRLVAVLSPEESAMMTGDPAAAIVVLMDVHSVAPMRATGASQVLPTGFPGVVSNETGRPGVVVAPGPAPSGTRTAARIVGAGDTVTEQDNVIGHVLNVGWAGDLVSSTWDQGPQALGIDGDGATALRTALTGHPVGSQVVVLHEGEDSSTSIYVVDILAVN